MLLLAHEYDMEMDTSKTKTIECEVEEITKSCKAIVKSEEC
jgi:chloramphenicol 3-O-phosphotransferase